MRDIILKPNKISESTTTNGKHVLLGRYGNAANKYEDPLSFYFNLEHVKRSVNATAICVVVPNS